MSDSIYIKEMIDKGQKQLEKAGVEDAASCARLLCCYVLDVPMSRLPLMYGKKLSEVDKWNRAVSGGARGGIKEDNFSGTMGFASQFGQSEVDEEDKDRELSYIDQGSDDNNVTGIDATGFLIRKYGELIDRKAAGEPLQYIVGEVEFMGLPFRVDERALIPRPETELLVEEALKILEEKMGPDHGYRNGEAAGPGRGRPDAGSGAYAGARAAAVCDLCCGSGAIGLALARLWKKSNHLTVTLTDISPDALSLAKENAKSLGLTIAGEEPGCLGRIEEPMVHFVSGDLFEPLKGHCFDIILSNPPYIPSSDIHSLQKEVKDHEPVLALDGGSDGLDIYRKIISEAPDHLNPGGTLMMEIGADQADQICELIIREKSLTKPVVIKDLAGRDRIIMAGAV